MSIYILKCGESYVFKKHFVPEKEAERSEAIQKESEVFEEELKNYWESPFLMQIQGKGIVYS